MYPTSGSCPKPDCQNPLSFAASLDQCDFSVCSKFYPPQVRRRVGTRKLDVVYYCA